MLSLAMVFCLAACGGDAPAPADDSGEVYALDEQRDTLLAEMYAAKDRVEALYG